MGEDTQEIYFKRLRRLTADEMRTAGERTIEEWTEPSKMPPLSFILERAVVDESTLKGKRFSSVADVDAERCPKGWTPDEVFRAHLTQERIRGGARAPMRRDGSSDFPTFDELGQRLKIPREQVQEWLQVGKEAQQEYYAKLEADPQWRAMAERLGAIPGLTPKAVPTTVPDDPDERAPWARAKAQEQGWTT